MAATCRCPPSTSRLSTHGFICSGHNGNRAHWLCKNCVIGSKQACPVHVKATVVPVRGLWDDTRFRPELACAPPSQPLHHTGAKSLDPRTVIVKGAGDRGFRVGITQPVRAAMVLKMNLSGVLGHRYAVLWPGQQEAWMFPRLAQQHRAAHQPPPTVQNASWWPAWTQRDEALAPKLLMGLNPCFVQSVMKSPCARTRWWFLLPQSAPPLLTPPAIAAMHGIERGVPNLGPRCNLPLRPYNPALETTLNGTLRCAWCKASKASKQDWLNTCAPDLHMFT